MRTAMGATRNEFASLVDEGVLLPRTRDPKNKAQWRLSDGLALVAELEAKASTISADDGSWESIQWCQKRTGLGVAAIIGAIREGQLKVGRRETVAGYTGLAVPRHDADRVAEAHRRSMNQNLLLATEFGRRVGLRDIGRLTAFLRDGHTPAQVIRSPRTGLERLYMSEADMAAFHRRYLTHLTIAERFGEHRNTILARLKAAGVAPFRPEGQDYGAIYLRHEVEAAYSRAGS